MAVPTDVRKRFYYVIPMPINAGGQGPADLHEAVELTWEIWTQELSSVASFEFLPDAIQRCEELNAEYHKEA